MFKLKRYPAILVLLFAGVLTIVLAYATLNLFHTSMANFRFLREFGWVAIMEGGLLQLVEIFANALVALLSYIGFKICEAELVHRYHNWQDK